MECVNPLRPPRDDERSELGAYRPDPLHFSEAFGRPDDRADAGISNASSRVLPTAWHPRGEAIKEEEDSHDAPSLPRLKDCLQMLQLVFNLVNGLALKCGSMPTQDELRNSMAGLERSLVAKSEADLAACRQDLRTEVLTQVRCEVAEITASFRAELEHPSEQAHVVEADWAALVEERLERESTSLASVETSCNALWDAVQQLRHSSEAAASERHELSQQVTVATKKSAAACELVSTLKTDLTALTGTLSTAAAAPSTKQVQMPQELVGEVRKTRETIKGLEQEVANLMTHNHAMKEEMVKSDSQSLKKDMEKLEEQLRHEIDSITASVTTSLTEMESRAMSRRRSSIQSMLSSSNSRRPTALLDLEERIIGEAEEKMMEESAQLSREVESRATELKEELALLSEKSVIVGKIDEELADTKEAVARMQAEFATLSNHEDLDSLRDDLSNEIAGISSRAAASMREEVEAAVASLRASYASKADLEDHKEQQKQELFALAQQIANRLKETETTVYEKLARAQTQS